MSGLKAVHELEHLSVAHLITHTHTHRERERGKRQMYHKRGETALGKIGACVAYDTHREGGREREKEKCIPRGERPLLEEEDRCVCSTYKETYYSVKRDLL
jgi:hypothetical protein